MSPRKKATGNTNKPATRKRAPRKPAPKEVEADIDIFSAESPEDVAPDETTPDIEPEIMNNVVESSLDVEKAKLEEMKVMKAVLEEQRQTFLEISKLEKENEAEKEAIEKAKENQKKQAGIITRGSWDFTPEDIKQLSKFDANRKKGVYYQFSVSEDSPRQAFAIGGQAFNKYSQVREDGNCPTCAAKMGRRKQLRTPITAGQGRPTCPYCGGVLDYSSTDEYTMVKIKQRYAQVSGDTLWLIAMLSHKVMIEVKHYDKVTNRNDPPIKKPAVEFAVCERVIFTADNTAIQETQRIDFKRIHDHYEATCIKDKNGSVIKQGEKKIFKFDAAPAEEVKKRQDTIVNIF